MKKEIKEAIIGIILGIIGGMLLVTILEWYYERHQQHISNGQPHK